MRASSRKAAASAAASVGSTWRAATTTFSSTVMRGKMRMFWKVRAMPDVAGDHIEERGLAGAIRADDAGDGVGLETQRDVVHRHHAGVAAGQAVGRDLAARGTRTRLLRRGGRQSGPAAEKVQLAVTEQSGRPAPDH